MKIFCTLLLFVSSVHGCELEKCQNMNFQQCPGWTDLTCREKNSLNLANKGLTGPIPNSFYTLYCTKVNGDTATGKPKVATTKVELQGNQLSGSISTILDCANIADVNLQGNPLTSDQTPLNTNADKLVTLNLAGTSQTDLKWLSGKAPNLKNLNIADNQIADLSPVLANKKLESLDLSGNKKIRDLTALIPLTSLKNINVDNTAYVDKLTTQKNIITSNGNVDDKRAQLMSASVGEIQKLAEKNVERITSMQGSVGANVRALQQRNQALEARLWALETALKDVSTACFATGVGFTRPLTTTSTASTTSTTGTIGTTTAGPLGDLGGKGGGKMAGGGGLQLGGGRRLATDCFQNGGGQPGTPGSGGSGVVSSATAIGVFWSAMAGIVFLVL